MSELTDVLRHAEHVAGTTAPLRDRDAFAGTAMRRIVRRRAARQALTAAAALVAVAGLTTGGWWLLQQRDLDPALPSVTASPSPTDSPTVAPVTPSPSEPSVTPDDRAAAPTTGVGLPTAFALTDEALAAAGPGWVLTVFDSTFRGSDGTNIDGVRVLYLVSPEGDRYEVANVTAYDSLNVGAWDTERGVALLFEDGATAVVVDIATGAVTNEWQFCGEGMVARAVDQPGEEWLLRGLCSGSRIDGRYADDGTPLGTDGLLLGEEFVGDNAIESVTITDIRGTQVRSTWWAVSKEEPFMVRHADGTENPLSFGGSSGNCSPLGEGTGDTFAVQCYPAAGHGEVWELPLDGGAPVRVAGGEIWGVLGMIGGAQPAIRLGFSEYCPAGSTALVQGTMDLRAWVPEVVTLSGPSGPALVAAPEGADARICYPGREGAALVSGANGELWTVNLATEVVTELLPVAETPGSGNWVGVEAGAIMWR